MWWIKCTFKALAMFSCSRVMTTIFIQLFHLKTRSIKGAPSNCIFIQITIIYSSHIMDQIMVNSRAMFSLLLLSSLNRNLGYLTKVAIFDECTLHWWKVMDVIFSTGLSQMRSCTSRWILLLSVSNIDESPN